MSVSERSNRMAQFKGMLPKCKKYYLLASPLYKTHIAHKFNSITFHCIACTKPAKWVVMYLCIRGIDFASFYDIGIRFWSVLWYLLFFIWLKSIDLWSYIFSLSIFYLLINIVQYDTIQIIKGIRKQDSFPWYISLQ